MGWRLARGVIPNFARCHYQKCEESPQKIRGVTPTPARSHPENGGMAPHQFFKNNSFPEVNKLRVLTVHEGHMGHYHHWRTHNSSSSCFCAILNVRKMRGVTPTDAIRRTSVWWHNWHFSCHMATFQDQSLKCVHSIFYSLANTFLYLKKLFAKVKFYFNCT